MASSPPMKQGRHGRWRWVATPGRFWQRLAVRWGGAVPWRTMAARWTDLGDSGGRGLTRGSPWQWRWIGDVHRLWWLRQEVEVLIHLVGEVPGVTLVHTVDEKELASAGGSLSMWRSPLQRSSSVVVQTDSRGSRWWGWWVPWHTGSAGGSGGWRLSSGGLDGSLW
jgi:hypothetical protein